VKGTRWVQGLYKRKPGGYKLGTRLALFHFLDSQNTVYMRGYWSVKRVSQKLIDKLTRDFKILMQNAILNVFGLWLKGTKYQKIFFLCLDSVKILVKR
jgi:hypothetical protein